MTTYLITGGAGSLGREMVKYLIAQNQKVRAFDNSESGLASLLAAGYPKNLMTVAHGNIQEYDRVSEAMDGCSVVIHTAAMKNIDITEGDVWELVKTNIIGTENVARAAKNRGVECAILISTDKAVEPRSAYGTSKLLAEAAWLCHAGQTMRNRFIVFRPGNFRQSAGNVFEVWQRQFDRGEPLTVTDPDMERYFIETTDAARIACEIPKWGSNGDKVIPKMRLHKIMDLMHDQFPGCTYRLIGSRPGEKMVETLIASHEKVIWENEDVMVVK